MRSTRRKAREVREEIQIETLPIGVGSRKNRKDAAPRRAPLHRYINLQSVDLQLVVDTEGAAETYHLVGAVESDPSAGRISVESPVGRALMGRKKGDKITVSVPSGTLTLTVKAVK